MHKQDSVCILVPSVPVSPHCHLHGGSFPPGDAVACRSVPFPVQSHADPCAPLLPGVRRCEDGCVAH